MAPTTIQQSHPATQRLGWQVAAALAAAAGAIWLLVSLSSVIPSAGTAGATSAGDTALMEEDWVGAGTPITVRSKKEQARAEEASRKAVEACKRADEEVNKPFVAVGFSPVRVRIMIPGESQDIAGIRGVTLPPDPRLEAVAVGGETVWAKGGAQTVSAPKAVLIDPPLSGRVTLRGPETFMDLAVGPVEVIVWTK